MANVSSDIKINVDYISAGCNCCPHSLDWQNGPRLIYGVTNSVALCSDVRHRYLKTFFSMEVIIFFIIDCSIFCS